MNICVCCCCWCCCWHSFKCHMKRSANSDFKGWPLPEAVHKNVLWQIIECRVICSAVLWQMILRNCTKCGLQRALQHRLRALRALLDQCWDRWLKADGAQKRQGWCARQCYICSEPSSFLADSLWKDPVEYHAVFCCACLLYTSPSPRDRG